MAIQMYLVQPRGDSDEESRASIAEFIAQRDGFILMATSHGSLIVAADEQHAPAIRAHPQVEFIGGVTLNPSGAQAAALQQLFAENVARQLMSRAPAPASPLPPPFEARVHSSDPAEYQPLRWPVRSPEGGDVEF
jgi:hypothetical protein